MGNKASAAARCVGFPGESKPAFRARIKREGKWGQYVQQRADYCAQHGVGTAAAHRAIYEGYPPPQQVNSEGSVTQGRAGEKTVQAGHSSQGGEPTLPLSSSNADLLDLSEFGGDKRVSDREIARWVFENVAVKDARPKNAPCAGAWGLLRWIRSSPHGKSEFYRNIWGRMLGGPGSAGEGAERFTDTGQEQLDLIDAVIAASEDAVLPSRAEGSAEQPALSAQDD